MWAALQADFPGVDAGHLDSLADDAVQSVGLLIDDAQQLLSPLFRSGISRDETGYRGLDGGEGRLQVVREAVEQGRSELFVPARRFGGGGPIDRAGPLQADRDQVGDGFDYGQRGAGFAIKASVTSLISRYPRTEERRE